MQRGYLTAIFAVVAVIAAACGSTASPSAGPPVPDHVYERLDGDAESLADRGGEPMVVNFFASWCPPCVAEMPDLETVHRDRQDEVQFVGLNTQDSATAARDLVELTGVTYDIGLDPDGELFRAFEVIAMPSTFFVDAEGAIVHRHAGIMTESQLRDLIDEHLTAP